MSAVTDLIGNATSSSYSAPSQYNTWQPQYTSGMDNSFNSSINQNQSNNAAVQPYWQQYLSQLTNNPYQAGAQTSANNAGTAYTNTGNQAVANSGTMSAAGNQILQTAMDPQNALYQQQYQQNMDQTNANEAARGITNSGYGANLANQSGTDFNIDWQNNQLARQAQGISSANSAFTNAGQLGSSGAQSIGAGGSAPLSTYNSGVSTLGQGLSGYGTGSTAINNSDMSSLLNYLGLAASQSNAQGNFNQQYWNDQNAYTSEQNAQNAAMWGDVGNIFQNPMDLSGISFMGTGIQY